MGMGTFFFLSLTIHDDKILISGLLSQLSNEKVQKIWSILGQIKEILPRLLFN